MATPFTEKVIATIAKIPRGKVATYRQIAALSGKPHASRGVSWVLNSSAEKHKLPWQRVVSSQGRISFKPGTRNFKLQKSKLQREGVRIHANGDIDMAKWQWKKKPREKRNQPHMFR